LPRESGAASRACNEIHQSQYVSREGQRVAVDLRFADQPGAGEPSHQQLPAKELLHPQHIPVSIKLATDLTECSYCVKPHSFVQSDRGGIRHCDAGHSAPNVFCRE
jgi:hypothetical protein